MFDRKRKTRAPCPGCGLSAAGCLCAEIPSLKLGRTHVDVLVHARELKRTTNTGRLVAAAIEGARLLVRGTKGAPLEMRDYLRSGSVGLILYPVPGAVELTADFARELGGARVHLIVPDGNWRQAAKVLSRHPELAAFTPVKLRVKRPPNQMVLRREHTEYGMSTLEGVAHCLSFLEGKPIGEALLGLYRIKLERTLSRRPGNGTIT